MKTQIIAIALFIGQIAFAQSGIINDAKKEEMNTYIKHFEKHQQLMGNVSIFENGQEVFVSNFGKGNIQANATETRKYTIGSITKMFTAVLFAKLQETDSNTLEESLSKYFPDIPNADKITIGHMLSHKSGLRDYVNKSDDDVFWLKQPRTEQEIIDVIKDQGAAFEPGDSLRYSNSAYYLLARILEKKHKKPFKNVISDEIVQPLNLKNTFGIDANSKHSNVASSFEKRNQAWSVMEEFYFPNASGAGDVISTATDLNTLLNAMFSYKVIKKSTLDAMLPVGNDWFGSGMMKAPFYEHVGYGHGGDTYGTHSVATYNPKNKLGITYIINGENYPTNDFAIGLLSIVYDREYSLPDFTEYKPEKRYFELYVGTYGAEGFPMDIAINEQEGELIAQGDGQPSFSLTPTEKHVFEFQKAGIKLEFDPEIGTMTLEQGGQKIELKKQ